MYQQLRIHLSLNIVYMSLLISLLLMLGIGSNTGITNTKDFQILGSISDTLFCLGFDDYLCNAFDIKNTSDQGWYDHNVIITLPYYGLECFEHLEDNNTECLKDYNIFEDASNIIVFCKYAEKGIESNYSLRFALIQNSYIELNKGIYIGMRKDDFCAKINLKNNINAINIIEFISSSNNYMGYFFFVEDKLSCILIELDDGNDNIFLSRLKNYPKYILRHVNKDAEYVFQGLPSFLINHD